MKIYIELVVIVFLAFIILVWYLWDTWSKKRIFKKYNPNENKSRKPRDFRSGAIETGEPTASSTNESVDRSPEPERRELLQTPDVGSGRKNSSGIRKLFKRRRKK